MAIGLLIVLFFIMPSTLKAEEINIFTPQNFYIKPFMFTPKTPAPDLDDLVRNNIPTNCRLKEINNDGADCILAIETIDIKAEPMPEDNELIEASLSMSLTYSLSGAKIKETSFKSNVLQKKDNEQDFVYNLIKEMITATSTSIFNLICLKQD